MFNLWFGGLWNEDFVPNSATSVGPEVNDFIWTTSEFKSSNMSLLSFINLFKIYEFLVIHIFVQIRRVLSLET